MSIIGQEIRALRKRHVYGQSLTELAQRTGLSGRALEFIERDHKVPTARTLEKIFDVLGTRAEEADRLHRLRAAAQARRQGLDVASRDVEQLPRLSRMLAVEAVVTVRQAGGAITDAVQEKLRTRFETVLKSVLSA